MKKLNLRHLSISFIGIVLITWLVLLIFDIPIGRQGKNENNQSSIIKSEKEKINIQARAETYVPLVVIKENLKKQEEAKEATRSKDQKPSKPANQPPPARSVKAAEPSDAPDQGKRADSGSIPNIFARYELPVSDYLSFMRYRGSRVIVYDSGRNISICEVSSNNKLVDYQNIDGFSRNSRRMTDDYPDRNLLRHVENKYGPGNYEILLILPDAFCSQFELNIENIMKAKGVAAQDASTVHIVYSGSDDKIMVNVEKVIGTFGAIIINRRFSL